MEEIEALIIDPEYSEVVGMLRQLMPWNKSAYLLMKAGRGYPGRPFSSQRYSHLQKETVWKLARDMNVKIRLKMKGELICDYCGEKIEIKPGNKGFTWHHEVQFYNSMELFSPSLSQFVHHGCHWKIHHEKK
jgi:hypothetical protein